MSPFKYVQEEVKNCKIHLKESYDENYALLKEATSPSANHYKTKVDVSGTLGVDMTSYYQYIFGIIRWII